MKRNSKTVREVNKLPDGTKVLVELPNNKDVSKIPVGDLLGDSATSIPETTTPSADVTGYVAVNAQGNGFIKVPKANAQSDIGAGVPGSPTFYWAGRIKSDTTTSAVVTTLAGSTNVTADSSGAFTWIQFEDLNDNIITDVVLNVPHHTLGHAVIQLQNGYYCKVYPQYSGSKMRILMEWFDSSDVASNMWTATGPTNELTFEFKAFN